MFKISLRLSTQPVTLTTNMHHNNNSIRRLSADLRCVIAVQ